VCNGPRANDLDEVTPHAWPWVSTAGKLLVAELVIQCAATTKRALYALDDLDGTPIGMILAIHGPDRAVELKAVAVDASLHGQGVGTRMLVALNGYRPGN
jgi:GNAT superfamily N-acetyltransferase